MAVTEQQPQPPLIVIVGPTASGKTDLAIRLAERYDGEIICADSRTIYRGLDIGTAKPTLEERRRVRHWGVDLVNPGDRFTVADFQQYATQAIHDIRRRDKVPFLVGGTGLYVDAVVFDYKFPPQLDIAERKKFERMSLDELYEYCSKHNINLPINLKNKRHVVNNILRSNVPIKRRSVPILQTIVVGITTKRTTLMRRIEARAEQIWTPHVLYEADAVAARFGWDNEAMTGNIYPLIRVLREEKLSLEEAKRKFVILDQQLAKRQMTWLRRSPYTVWLTIDEAYDYCVQALNKLNKT